MQNNEPEHQGTAMTLAPINSIDTEGILIVDKGIGKTSFSLVRLLRKLTGVQKIGHAGTLDPFATGVMVMCIGPKYTRLSHLFSHQKKEYTTTLRLGMATDSYDCDGVPTKTSDVVPSREAVERTIGHFQGTIRQIPPMFSAKKVRGTRLYQLARKGITIDRAPVSVELETELLEYQYPWLSIRVQCTSGTYVRSIAHDMGEILMCGAHLVQLTRTRSGPFSLSSAVPQEALEQGSGQWRHHLQTWT